MTSRVVPSRLRQVVVVLSVLAGLLAMHGLISGHGAPASPPGIAMTSMAEPRTDLPSPIAATLGDAPAESALTVADTTSNIEAAMLAVPEAATDSSSFAAHGSAMTGMLLTCLAILPGGLLLGLLRLLPGRRHLPSRRDHLAPPTGRLLTKTLCMTSPPDLVAGLCVSRT